MKEDSYFTRLKNNFKDFKKKDLIIIGVLACAVAVLFISSLVPKGDGETSDNTKNVYSENETKIDIEKRLSETLSKISGVGDVSVMITYYSSSEKITAVTKNDSTSTSTNVDSSGSHTTSQSQSQSSPITSKDSPIVVKEIEPEVKGAIIVAQGAESLEVRVKLQSAAQTILGIEAHQVKIYEMD